MKNVYIITGAAGGMGKDCAFRFKDKGDLILSGLNLDELNTLKKELNSSNKVEIIKCDTTIKEDLQNLLELTKQMGNLKGIFHFAGVSEAFGNPEKIMEINLVGTALLVETLSPSFNDETVVINTSSMTSYTAPIIKDADELMKNPLQEDFIKKISPYLNNDNNISYYLSKRGVRLLTEKYATEYGKTRFISISPGVILTPMVEEAMKSHTEVLNQMIENTPVKRIGTPKDISDLVEFLCSDKATFINGSDIRIDGGLIPVMTKRV